MATTQRTYKLPFRIEFRRTVEGRLYEVPGDGSAGWTVRSFGSSIEREAFMAYYPQSRMPTWSRIEANTEL